MANEDFILDPKPDGTARLLLFGKPVRLGKPTMRTLRLLSDGIDERADEVQDSTEDLQARLREAAADLGVDLDTDPVADSAGRLLGHWARIAAEMTEDERATRTDQLTDWVTGVLGDMPEARDDEPVPKEWKRTRRDLIREHNRTVQALFFDLARQIWPDVAPSNSTLPAEDDDMDPALANPRLYAALRDHWTAVPLPSGASVRPTP